MNKHAPIFKHIVLQGGGGIGFRYIGIIQYLIDNNVLNMSSIESIYATSIGGVIGALLCLNIPWVDITEYIVNRPWNDVFKITGKHILDMYSSKGIFNESSIDILFKPLLNSKQIPANITLRTLFNFSGIDIHFFSFDLNTHTTIDISHTTHPDLMLSHAIYMTAALPILFAPMHTDNACYIDGGIACNYPLHVCLDKYGAHNKKHILGVRYMFTDTLIPTINPSSNIFEYLCALINSQIIPTEKQHNIPNIPHEIICKCNKSPLNVHDMWGLLADKSSRQRWINYGKIDANEWYINLTNPNAPSCANVPTKEHID